MLILSHGVMALQCRKFVGYFIVYMYEIELKYKGTNVTNTICF